MTKQGSNAKVNTASPLHNRIPVLRAELGISRQELADRVGVNYQTIGYLERGDYNPSLELAFRVADVFALPIEAVFSRTAFTPLSAVVYPQGRRAAARDATASSSDAAADTDGRDR